MRLTNAMRDTVIEYIVNKVYPSKENELKKNLLELMEKNEEWMTRKRLAEDYPKLVRATNSFWFNYDDNYYNRVFVEMGYPVASADGSYWYLSYREDRSNGFYCKGMEKIGIDYATYCRDKSEYKDKVSRIVLSCNSTKQLYEAIPEIDGYFGEESKVAHANALVPQALIDEVRAKIPQLKEN